MNRTTLREIAIPLVSLIVLALIGYLAYTRLNNRPDTVNAPEQGNLLPDPQDDPALLPPDLPFAPGVSNKVGDYEVITKEGIAQGIAMYESTQSLSAEVSAFKKYLARAGWTIIDEQKEGDFTSFLTERDSRQMTAHMFRDDEVGITNINISVINAPPTP